MNPLKEEAYHVLACLYRKRKDFPEIGFNPDFLRAMFGPFLLNKKSGWDWDIHDAVKLWCSDPATAEQKYGHINKWDVSHVTNMSELFRDKQDFNEDISGWDTSNVEHMQHIFNDAPSFNQSIGGLNASNVTSMMTC